MNWKSETTFRPVSQFSNVPARAQTSLCASPAKRHRRTLSYSSNVAAFAPDARAQPNVTTVADTVTLASHALMNHAVYVAVVPTPMPGAQPRLPNVFTAAAPIQPLNHAAPDGKRSVDSSRCALRRLCPYRDARRSPLSAVSALTSAQLLSRVLFGKASPMRRPLADPLRHARSLHLASLRLPARAPVTSRTPSSPS